MEQPTTFHIVLSFLSMGIFVIFVIVFKDRLSALEIDPRKIRIRAEFVQGVEEMESRAKDHDRQWAPAGSRAGDRI